MTGLVVYAKQLKKTSPNLQCYEQQQFLAMAYYSSHNPLNTIVPPHIERALL